MVDPRTHEWTPRGRLTQWQPHVDHVAHLLHALRDSFNTEELDAVAEYEATNKQVWKMYHHSRQTFLLLTAQRAKYSSTPEALYNDSEGKPQTQKSEGKTIRFTQLDEEAVGRLWVDLRRSLGE